MDDYESSADRIRSLHTGQANYLDVGPITAKTAEWGRDLLTELKERDRPAPSLINEVPADNEEEYPPGYSPNGASLFFEWWFSEGDCPYMSLEMDPFGLVTGLADPSAGGGQCGEIDNMTVRQARTTNPEETADFFEHCTDEFLSL